MKSLMLLYFFSTRKLGFAHFGVIQFNKIIFLPDLEYSRETCGNYDNAIFFNSGSYLELRNKIINKLLKENKEDTINKNNTNSDKIKSYNWNNLWPKIV